jgi:hypothetical protein
MTDPEYYFDERNLSDYWLFGIRYLIIPTGSRPPVPARLEVRAGPYSLWTLPGPAGVLRAGAIVGTLSADRTNIGTHNIPLLNSWLAQAGDYLRVKYGSDGGGDGRVPMVRNQSSAGAVLAERADLRDGEGSATLRMRRPGVAVLSASFDPGWTATVDGRQQRTEMVAPALVATTVPTGKHRITFRYRGWPSYSLLFAVGAAALVALAYTDIRRARPPGIARGH